MKYSRTNENETIIENKICDIFPNQVFMEPYLGLKPWKNKMSLQT
jgi:hypothetical protein